MSVSESDIDVKDNPMDTSTVKATISSMENRIRPLLKKGILGLPKRLLMPFSHLPSGIQLQVLDHLLNHVFKKALQDEELDFLIDNWLHIHIKDANFHCYLSAVETEKGVKIQVALQGDDKNDVCFSADTKSLMLVMSKAVDPDTLFFKRKLLITGDTELGLEIKNFLDDFDMDGVAKIANDFIKKFVK